MNKHVRTSSERSTQDNDGTIYSHKLNRSFSEEAWEIDDPNKVSLEDASSGRLSAFYLSTLRQQLSADGQNQVERGFPGTSTISSQNAETMDYAERAIHRIADARDEVQKKTFTKWVNKYLAKVNHNVGNLYEDLRDGHNLIALLEALSGITLPREKGRMRFHRLQNVQIALDFLKQRKLRLVNIRNDDITDGNPKLILGLIWTIILHFQIEDITFEGSEDLSARQALLIWVQRNMEGYEGVEVTNFSSSWRNGRAFNVILHRNGCEVIEMDEVLRSDNNTNLDRAFAIAEKEFGVTRLLDPEDVNVDHPDERSIITYVSSLYDIFPQIPPLPMKVTEEQWLFTWEEYLLLKSTILEWIQEQIIIMRTTKDIDSAETLADIEKLQYEMARFKDEDIPVKETDLQSLVPKYQSVERLSVESRGKYRPVDGNEPHEVLSAWESLGDAIKWREIQLTSKYDRLKFLNDVLCKTNHASSECRENLENAKIGIKQIANGDDNSVLQEDVTRLLSSSQAQIQTMYTDVQILKDEGYPQADSVYKTVFALHEKCVALRSEFNVALEQLDKLRLEAEKQKQERIIETNEYKFLQECITTANNTQHSLENLPWGNDLPGVNQQMEEFSSLHKDFRDLSEDSKACQNEHKEKLTEEFANTTSYTSLLLIFLSKLEKLEETVRRKKSYLDDLSSFINEATEHLAWMQDKEDLLLSEDMTSFDLGFMEKNLMALTAEMEARQPHVTAILKAGQEMTNHPAYDVISAYVTAITKEWQRLQDLCFCLQEHIKDVIQQKAFENSCEQCEKSLRENEEILKAVYECLKEPDGTETNDWDGKIQKVEENLNNLQAMVESLQEQSKVLPAVLERNSKMEDDTELPLMSLCDYTEKNFVVVKGERCVLLDNTDKSLWRVKTLSKSDVPAPSLVFRISPASKMNLQRAKDLLSYFTYVVEEHKKSSTHLQFIVLLLRFKTTCQYMMTLKLEDCKSMSSSEKANLLSQLNEDLTSLNKYASSTSDEITLQQIESCNKEFEQCNRYISELFVQLEMENKLEEQCETYTSHINVFIRRLADVEKVVVLRVLSDLPDEKHKVELVMNDHKGSIEELNRCEPHYNQVCEESRAIAEENPDFSSCQQLSSQLHVAIGQWKSTWNITHMYLDKLKMVCILLEKLDDVNRTITDTEAKLSTCEVDYQDQESDFNKVLQEKTFIEHLQITLNSKAALTEELVDNKDELQDISSQVEYPIAMEEKGETVDQDVEENLVDIDLCYSIKVDKTLERFEQCQTDVSERLQKIQEILPEAESVAAEERKAQDFISKIQPLQKKIDAINAKQIQSLTEPLSDSPDILQSKLDDQQNALYEIELLKSEYDQVQADVVNFINNEATGRAKNITQLREELHTLQNSWSKAWLITHVHFEKIKGLRHIAEGLNQCENMINDIENVVCECEKSQENIAGLKARNQQIEEVAKLCPTIDDNLDVLQSNLASTQNVISQFPEDIPDTGEVTKCTDRVKDLTEKWKLLKERLKLLSVELNANLTTMEKSEELKNELLEIMRRVRKFNSEMNTVVDSQNVQMAMPCSLDMPALKRNITKQDDVGESLHLKSAEYYDLSADCSDNLNVTESDSVNMNSEVISKLLDAHQDMIKSWDHANEAVDLFYSKLKDLKSVVETLQVFEEAVSHSEEVLQKYDQASSLALLRQQREDIQKLEQLIPENDSIAGDCNTVVQNLINTGDKIKKSDSTSDEAKTCMEIQQCKEELNKLNERWEKAKQEIRKQLPGLDDAIARQENEEKFEDAISQLLSDIEQLLSELSKIESAQLVRADVTLPADDSAISQIIAQQQSVGDALNGDLKKSFEDISKRCQSTLGSDVKVPAMNSLHSNFTKLCLEWQKVSTLVGNYMAKLLSVQVFLKYLILAQTKLKFYQTEIQKINAFVDRTVSGHHSVAEIKDMISSVENLRKRFYGDEEAVRDVETSLQRCYDTTYSQTDQDLPSLIEKCEVFTRNWEAMKKSLQDIDLTLSEQLTSAEKRKIVNKECEGVLFTLAKYQKDVDRMQSTIEARIVVALPADVDSIEAVAKQEVELGDELVQLNSQCKVLHAKCDDLDDVSTPAVKLLQEKFILFFENWATVYRLHEECMKKLRCVAEAADSICITETIVHSYANQLILQDTMADNKEGLEKQRLILQKLVEEIPENDVKFDMMEEKYTEVNNFNNKMKEENISVENNFKPLVENLNKRWNSAKEQALERLTLVQSGEEKLKELEERVKEQDEMLQEKEAILNAQDLPSVEESSTSIQKLIEDTEKLQESLTVEYSKVENLYELSNQFNDVARTYDKVAAAYDDTSFSDELEKSRPTEEELEERATKRQKIIEFKVITITQRFDKLKNLISEKIEQYKIAYKVAVDKEKSITTTTTTEITTTRTRKKRNLRDIIFTSYLKKHVSALDLHNAGIVPDEMAEKLELGVLHEEDVEGELRTYLKGNEPIAGLIVKKANDKKISINRAMKLGLIKAGTGLVLLEAQAATGNIIDPHTAEHMSVSEAAEKGVIDRKYEEALIRAEKAVTGYEDPVTHKLLSLYECMRKGFIVETHGIRLLEAQIATGGLIDPRAHHRVPISVAYKRGLFDERMNKILEDPSDDTKGFFDPNTEKNLTYLDLVSKCLSDENTGLLFLELTRDDIDVSSLMPKQNGVPLKKRRSHLEIRFSTAFHDEANLEDIYEAGLVTEEQVRDLETGRLMESDLYDQLKTYLFGGEEPVSGVILESTGEMLSIMEAINRGIIKRGTGIELLEAQAATGNIIDPKTVTKMTVANAYRKGLIDKSHVDTLERAERAVRGYPVPGSDKILSLFGAMKKGLVVESRGIRLLEAQIATGGLIDPRAHHRVPISVAYKRGLFDERMNQILEDPSDDTKGFFDPNTEENLSYLDLMRRCEIRPPSNLRFLVLKSRKDRSRSGKKKSSRQQKQEKAVHVEEVDKPPPADKRDGKNIKFDTLFQTTVSLDDLVRYGIVSTEVALDVKEGKQSKEELEISIRTHLFGAPSIGGLLLPRTGEKLSFHEATKRKILTTEQAYQYLEAQVCTGCMINPKNGEKLTVLDAYMSGLMERDQINRLLPAEEAVFGHVKLGAKMKLTLAEMLDKGVVSIKQAVRYMHCQQATGGIIDATKCIRLPKEGKLMEDSIGPTLLSSLKSEAETEFFDPATETMKSYEELLKSCKPDKTTSVMLLPCATEETTVEATTTTTPRIIKKRTEIFFETTLHRRASLIDLLEAGIVTEETVSALEEGKLTEEEVAQSIRQYLVGEQPIAGLIVEATGEKFGVLDCIRNGMLKRGTGLELLEAQAAIGCILDPRTGERYDVQEALNHQLIDNTQVDALQRAQRAVTGYKNPVSRGVLSLFEAMNKGYVTESRGIRLLEAQVATGGLIDPTTHHRVPISVAYKRGIIGKKMYGILTDPSDDTKGFFDPNTNENLTYLDLMLRSYTEPSTGLVYLMLKQKKSKSSRHKESKSSKRKKRTTQRSRKVVIIDPDSGAELTIQEALDKGLIDKETAKKLQEQEGEWTEESKVRGKEKPLSPSHSNTVKSMNFNTHSSDLAAKSPLSSNDYTEDVFSEKLSARLLHMAMGPCEPIAGIIDVKKGECVSLREAEKRRLIDKTSAIRLLEAQVATGGIINPTIKDGRRYTVNDAVTASLIERRVAQRLEIAEKSFRGFYDHRSKEFLSLGQALKKGLCYYENGNRLLEFQTATGGLINPKSGERVSLEQALQDDWIDNRTYEKLRNLSKYSKSIVDLKTNLLMSYPDALDRSVVEPETGHRFLEALPRTDRNLRIGRGVTVQASSLYGSRASSLASSLAASPVGSRRHSIEEDQSPIKSPNRI